MQVFDCLKKASILLGDTDEEAVLNKAERINKNLSEEILSDLENKKIEKYLNAFNMAVEKLACEYINLKISEKLYANMFSNIYFDAFQYRVVEVLGIEDINGKVCTDYKILPFSILVPKNYSEYVVTYRYIPNEAKTIFDEIAIPGILTSIILSYLVCAFLSVSVSLFDEAKMWEEKFEEELFRSLHRRKDFRLKKFGFI